MAHKNKFDKKKIKQKAESNKLPDTDKNIFMNKMFLAIYVLFLCVAFFKVYNTVYDSKISLLGDNAAYYILGNSLSSGQGYTNIHQIEQNPAKHFPPGYPAIIAAAIKVFPNQISTVKKVNGFFLLATIILSFFLFRKLTRNIHLSFITSLFILYNYHLLYFSTIMMSELSFLFFSTLCLFLFFSSKLDKPIYKNIPFLALILTLSFVYHIRTAGVAVFGGMFLVLLINKNWKYLSALTVGFITMALPWYIRGKLAGGNSYVSELIKKNPYRPELGTMELGDWFSRFFKNVERYVTREIPSGCFSFIQVDYKSDVLPKEWIIGILIILVVSFGIFMLQKNRIAIIGYLLGTFAILFLWPEAWFGVRFLMMIIPLLIFLFGNGIYEFIVFALSKINIKRSIVIQMGVPLAFLMGISLYQPNIDKLKNQAKSKIIPKYAKYFEIANWARKNTEKDVVICCRKPQLFYLFANRFVTNYSYTLDKEKFIESLQRKQTSYVVLEQLGYSSTGRYLYPAIQRYPEKFKTFLHLKDPDTYLLEFDYEMGYLGEWNEDIKEGHGTYKWPNGNKFEGEWKDNTRNGNGTLTFPDGSVLSATWINDSMEGEATLTSKDGLKIRKSVYKNNIEIKRL